MKLLASANSIGILFAMAYFPLFLSAQNENVVLKWKSLAGFPGNEMRFMGAILPSTGTPSTTLYMQLYSDSGGTPLNKWIWRSDGGHAAGNFPLPDKPGFYWVRAYTCGSDFFVFSLRVRPRNPTYTIRKFRDSISGNTLNHSTIWLSHDGRGYYLLRTDPAILYYAVAVQDTGGAYLAQTWTIQKRVGPYTHDTGYLQKRFIAIAKQPINRQEIVYMLPQDTTYTIPDTKRLDSAGQLAFNGLRFEDSCYIFYKQNRSDEEILLKELRDTDVIPPFSIPTDYSLDTVNRDPTPLPGERGAKVLDTVYKRINYARRNVLLHNKYVKGDLYLEAGIDGHFNYDLRVDTPRRWSENVLDYLSRDVHPQLDGAPEFYLDGQWQPSYMVEGIDLNSIRYIEIRRGDGVWSFWDGTLHVNYVLMYTKRGSDGMHVDRAFKHLAMKGYDSAPTDDLNDQGNLRFSPKIRTVKYYLGRKPPFRLSVMTVFNGQFYYRDEIITLK